MTLRLHFRFQLLTERVITSLPEDQLKLEANDQVLFRYCDSDEMLTQVSNPNGSVNNIAGVCNDTKNVFGMMPHPERACSDDLGNTDGIQILQGLLELVELVETA